MTRDGQEGMALPLARATHEQSQQAVSAVPVGIANVERRIPASWFSAQVMATTMGFLKSEAQARLHPLAEGERNLGVFVLPPFQRPPVWTREQQARFIESCWLGLPIGAFVFNRTRGDGPRDSWLLDGQQRVTAAYAYMADEYPVFGCLFSELPAAELRKWHMGVSFPALRTQLESDAECLEVYNRLAYGGTAHEPEQDHANG